MGKFKFIHMVGILLLAVLAVGLYMRTEGFKTQTRTRLSKIDQDLIDIARKSKPSKKELAKFNSLYSKASDTTKNSDTVKNFCSKNSKNVPACQSI